MSHHDHQHGPGCDHDHGPQSPEPTQIPALVESDTAAQSLQDALRKTFVILKGIMVLLVLWFLTSGIFSVQENEKALILRFGKIRPYGVEGKRVLDSGLKWTWPAPISEIIKIPTTQQTLEINDFWYFMTDAEKLDPKSMAAAYAPPTMDPTRDGYCLTRSESRNSNGGIDYNIVHCRWQLTYQIDDPANFFQNMYHRPPGPGQTFMSKVAESVHPLLKALAADAIVATLVRYSIDEVIVSQEGITDTVKKTLQDKLNAIHSGLVINSMVPLGKITWPKQVNEAFLESNRATQQKQQKIDQAKGYASKLLNESGGAKASLVLEKMKSPSMTDAQREQLCSELAGASQEVIAEARAYRTKVVEETKSSAEYLRNLLPEYQKRPQLVLQKIYQDAIEEVMQNAQEKIVLQPSGDKAKEFRILINRDPAIRKIPKPGPAGQPAPGQ
jgi:modulator of FtsH protease HflK